MKDISDDRELTGGIFYFGFRILAFLQLILTPISLIILFQLDNLTKDMVILCFANIGLGLGFIIYVGLCGEEEENKCEECGGDLCLNIEVDYTPHIKYWRCNDCDEVFEFKEDKNGNGNNNIR